MHNAISTTYEILYVCTYLKNIPMLLYFLKWNIINYIDGDTKYLFHYVWDVRTHDAISQNIRCKHFWMQIATPSDASTFGCN